MDPVEIKFETTKRDWVAFDFSELIHRRDTRRRLALWALVPPAVLVALALLITLHLNPGRLRAVGTWVALLILPFYLMLVYGVVISRLNREVERSIKAGRFVGSCQVLLSQEGITVTRGRDVISKNWKEIPRVTGDNDYGFIYLSMDNVVPIPRRCFSDSKSFEMFMKSAILFHWHGENAVKAAAAASTGKGAPKPVELQPALIQMPT